MSSQALPLRTQDMTIGVSLVDPADYGGWCSSLLIALWKHLSWEIIILAYLHGRSGMETVFGTGSDIFPLIVFGTLIRKSDGQMAPTID
jgi:hypothetical protein